MSQRTDPSAATVKAVRRRDLDACARCGQRRALSTHHRRNRGMGGSRWPGINLPSNLASLCGSGTTGDHGWVTDHPAEAKRLGLAVAGWADPVTVPMFTWRGWLLLDGSGGYVETDEPPGADAHALAERVMA